jgi:hypothetical protein
VDAGHLFELISAQAPQAAALAQAVHAAMASAVAYQVTGPATSSSHGMSIYFPPAAVYYDPEFDQAVGVERWRALLKAYYQAAAAARAPEFACGASGACTHTPTNTEETLRGRLASGSVAVIADAVVRYGVPTNGDVGVFLLGDAPASYWTASGVEWAEGTWDYSLLSLEQGTLSSYGYLSWQDLGAGKVRATIPLAYWESPSNSPVLALWQLVFQGGSLIQDTYFAVSDTGAVAELAPVAGSVFQTVVAYQEALAAAWAPSWTYFTGDARFDAAQPIGPNLVTLNTNVRFFMSLAVENAAGAGDHIYAITTRPYY